MKIIYSILFFIACCNLNSYCQYDGPASGEDYMTNPSWEFYSNNTLSSVASGKGFTGIAGTGDISSVVLNPASFYTEKNFNVNFGYTYKGSITWAGYPTYSYYKQNLPSLFFGCGIKINNFLHTGFTYRNDYSFRTFFEEVTTIIHPEGGMSAEDKFTTHTFSLPIVFNYKWMRIGTELNLTYFRQDSYISPPEPLSGYSELWRFIPRFGFIITPVKNFSFGATLTPGFTDSTEYDLSYTATTNKSVVKYPNRIGIGTELRLLNDKLALSLDYQFSGTSKLRLLKDMHNIHLGAEYKIDDSWKIRCGFFTLFDFRGEDPRVSYGKEIGAYDQYFITFGGTYKYKNSDFNLAFMDSHLLTNSIYRHTKISLGINFDL